MRLTDKGTEKGTESDSGAGIGSGSAGIGGGMITIAGGSVYAAASVGAGIGGGYKGTSGSIVISGGDVEARGGEYNSTVKALGNASGTLNDFYRQMLVEAPENRQNSVELIKPKHTRSILEMSRPSSIREPV